MAISIHPAIDQGIKAGAANFAGGTLKCNCAQDAVEVAVSAQCAHNHACGCTQCWKPAGAVVLADRGGLARQGQRHRERRQARDRERGRDHSAVRLQGVRRSYVWAHLYGRIENQGHAFYGLDFIHTELSSDEGWEEPRFAAFVSSVIESGTKPEEMDGIRARLRELRLEPYDCLSPGLMDALATHAAKVSS